MRRIAFDLGTTTFYARLLEDTAPNTTAALWQALPFGGRAVHAKWSGNMFRMLDAAPLSLTQVESGLSFQYPGLMVYYPPLQEIAICYGDARFRGSAGPEYVTPIAEIEGDLTTLASTAAKLQWEGATPIHFHHAPTPPSTQPLIPIPADGPHITITIDDQVLQATLLQSFAPRTCAAFQALLPLDGHLTNTKWSGDMAHFWVGERDLRGPIGLTVDPLEHPTRFHWPGYLYFHPTYHGIRIPYGDAQQSGAFNTSQMTPLARFDDASWPIFRDLATNLHLSGAHPMSIKLE